MANSDLNNNLTKVVQYSILSIRNEGKVFPGFPKTKVVSDAMTDDGFAAWAMSEYMEKCPKISHKDKKSLRVCYEVMCSYPKPTYNYKKKMVRAVRKKAKAMKQTVKILKQIRDALRDKAEVNNETEDKAAIDTTPQVVITYIFYKGEVKRVQSDEYIEITNQGNIEADISGWRIYADPRQNFIFPPGTVLQPQQSVRVYTNEIHPETGGFSFGIGRAIWNDQGDVGTLYDAEGNVVSRYGYGEKQITEPQP